jgi:hypothetical protein
MTVAAIENMKKTIFKLAESGRQAGELHTDTDTNKMAEVIICLIEGGSLLSKTTGKDTYMMNSLGQIEALIQSAASAR